MQSTLPKDKVMLDVTDNPKLAEFFSRMESGDTFRFEATLSMEEKADGMIVSSIDECKVKPAPDDGDGDENNAGEPVEDDKTESPAVKAMKAQVEDDTPSDNPSGTVPPSPQTIF